jgi:hypothetical protein
MPNTSSAPSETFQVPVEIIGADLYGQQFLESTRTLTICRNGISTLLATELAPDSEVIVRNPEDGNEALAYVIGQTRENKSGEVYGFAFIDPSANLWHIPFPPSPEAISVELQCSRCHTARNHSFTEIEFEIFRVTRESIRFCKICNSPKIWREPGAAPAAESQRLPPPRPISTAAAERRKNKRTAMKTVACIRLSGMEVVVACENVSKGGFRFISCKEYPPGTTIEAAVPYTKSSTNIFCVSGIIYCHKMPDGQFRHGVTYIRKLGSIGRDS